MSPPPLVSLSSHTWEGRDQSQTQTNFAAVKSQWQNPTDILSILMIIGGDVVQCALTQLVGTSVLITPVAFSFGWVAYAFSAILSAVGAGNVTPEPDTNVTCINVKSGYSRDVKSWALARLYRDIVPPQPHNPPPGLTLMFYRTTSVPETGVRSPDWVFYLGVFAIVLQLGIACIPGGLQGNWVILIITVGGNLLVQLTAALPQWKAELWRSRDLKPKLPDRVPTEVVCLTAGNGSSHVVVIKSIGCGRRLEDLAAKRIVPSFLTSIATFILAILWIVHLMTVQSVEHDGWYLLAIGGIGMFQNIISAGARRKPSALGFHLEDWYVGEGKKNSLQEDKVFRALQAAEGVEKNLGLVLLDIFFPGGLRPDEEKWRKDKLTEYKETESQAKDTRKTGDMDSTPVTEGSTGHNQGVNGYRKI